MTDSGQVYPDKDKDIEAAKEAVVDGGDPVEVVGNSPAPDRNTLAPLDQVVRDAERQAETMHREVIEPFGEDAKEATEAHLAAQAEAEDLEEKRASAASEKGEGSDAPGEVAPGVTEADVLRRSKRDSKSDK